MIWAFELRLTFSGLTGLVPLKEANDPDPAERWAVVLPALQGGDYFSKGGRKFSIAPHQAMLSAKAEVVRANESREESFRITANKQSTLLYQLGYEILKIESGNPGLRVRSTAPAVDLPDVKDPDQLHDIKWVPPIDVSFNRDLLGSVALPTEQQLLAGAVMLDRGVLETSDVHRGFGNAPVPYQFRKGSPPQALAKSFRLRVPVADETATLILTDPQENQARLVVGPYEPSPGSIFTDEQLREVLRGLS